MIIYTKHLLERIKEKNITLEEIETLLINENISIQKDEYSNFLKQEKINGYIIRVIFREENTNIIVITAYKTSKIKKYQ